MTIFVPLIYLFAGWLMGKTAWDVKTAASWLLTRVTIPIVIIFNISTRFSSMSTIIIATAICMLLMLMASRYIIRDPIKSLCFSYLNIGWLGLPVATAMFGNEAATIIIAAYVGSSIVGNSVGAGMLSGHRFNLVKLVQTPPVLALIFGAVLIPFNQQITLWFSGLYDVAKFLMSFLGMAVLGIWLSKIALTWQDLRQEIRPYLIKSGVMFILISLLLMLARTCDFRLIAENPATLYLFCLLPPAANIIVLETHYLGTGRSAKLITCGTCISIIALSLFAAAVTIGRTIGIGP
ncbi:AEC family transporter [Pantoea sp. At-9b]|uniref:AEC family transporter n=1 Tax=Pantoea sp. (strain At-9b) TaxID=592316 RepID=UPI0001B400A8|nr:permease [Pantoea sp. At-9b]ADU71455.1 putative permease [Pantoea sp. At-9b]